MLKNIIVDVRLKNRFLQKLSTVPFSIQKQTYKRLQLFKQDPFDSQLRNHALREPYLGSRNIDITDDYRAIFKEYRGEAHFYRLGTHPELYGENNLGS